MRAFVIAGPGRAQVEEVAPPVAGRGEVVVQVERAGVCGTDIEFFTGDMAYLHSGDASYPMRIGHEWSGTVAEVGAEVDPGWLGRRVTGDTMLGCGRCERCRAGRQHLCANRFEVGIRGGWPGALAEQLVMPASALLALPETVDATLGALVEPGGNALRAFRGANVTAGERLLVIGPGTLGLLVGMIARAHGIEVHLRARSERSAAFARSIGFDRIWTAESPPPAKLRFDAIVDTSNSPAMPAFAVERVEPGRRVVFVGLAGEPSLVDTRALALNDVTAVGVLSGSDGLRGAIELYAAGTVDPRPLVGATVALDDVRDVLVGERSVAWGSAPKIHVDPRLGRRPVG